MHNVTDDLQAFRRADTLSRANGALHPCGVPVSVAGKLHRSQCITCQRETWQASPYTTPELESDPNRGRPIITTRRIVAA